VVCDVFEKMGRDSAAERAPEAGRDHDPEGGSDATTSHRMSAEHCRHAGNFTTSELEHRRPTVASQQSLANSAETFFQPSSNSFTSRNAVSAVYIMVIIMSVSLSPSICLSVCPSTTSWYSIKMA